MRQLLGGGNRRLLERTSALGAKAAIQTSDIATNGRLYPEQANRFIDYVVDQSVMFKSGIRVVRMGADRHDVDKLSVGTRILRKATENDATATPVGITTAKKQLSVTEIILPADVTFSFLEDNIEREGFQDHLMSMFGVQLSNDLEDLAINGDSTTGSFLSIESGWLKLAIDDAETHIYDTNGGTDFRGTIFEGMLEAMPAQYRANRNNLKFFTSVNVKDQYRYQLGQRQTAGGDSIIQSDGGVMYAGIEVIGVPYMPDGSLMLTVPDNLVFGIRRDVNLGIWKNERKRVWEYTWTLRVDYQTVNGLAMVLGYNA